MTDLGGKTCIFSHPVYLFLREFSLQDSRGGSSQPGASVARIAREHDINDNLLFKWLRLWQNEGRISRRLQVTTSSDTGVELLPVEITPDEQKEPVAAIAPSLSTSTQTSVSAGSCKVEFRHGNMTLENPSPELLTLLIRELTGRGR
ncbi:TPA: transposase [Escherichia coli]